MNCVHCDGYGFCRIYSDLDVDVICPGIRDCDNYLEAEEVVHGKWIKGKYPGEYTCSRCGMEYCEADPADKPFNYCPECGSKNE